MDLSVYKKRISYFYFALKRLVYKDICLNTDKTFIVFSVSIMHTNSNIFVFNNRNIRLTYAFPMFLCQNKRSTWHISTRILLLYTILYTINLKFEMSILLGQTWIIKPHAQMIVIISWFAFRAHNRRRVHQRILLVSWEIFLFFMQSCCLKSIVHWFLLKL